MLTEEDDVEIHALARRGWSVSAIAGHTGRDRKTVRKYLAGARPAREPAPTCVEPFRGYLAERFVEDAHVDATVLFREVCELGFERSYVTFARAVRELGLRPRCEACRSGGHDATVSLVHEPGEEIQFDWLELTETPWGEPAYVLVGALCFSGRLRAVISEGMTFAHGKTLRWRRHRRRRDLRRVYDVPESHGVPLRVGDRTAKEVMRSAEVVPAQPQVGVSRLGSDNPQHVDVGEQPVSKPEADLRLPSLLGAPLAWAVEQKAAKIQPGAEVRRAGVKRLEVGTAGLGSGAVLLGAFADREVRIRPPILGAQRCGPQVLVADVRRGLAAAAGSQRHPPRPPARRDPGRVRLGYHMHVFTSGADEFGVPDPELGFMDERRVSLGQLIGGAGDRLGYTYDFGDAWEHEIVVEELLDANPEVHYPVLVAAKGACPPEDCGGPWGYAELKEILADPTHDQHQEMLTWLGLDDASGFDPSGLAVDEIEEELALSAADR